MTHVDLISYALIPIKHFVSKHGGLVDTSTGSYM
jgi:hypothetical protein